MEQSKTRNIIYWVSTVMIGFLLLSSGMAEIMHYSGNVEGIVKKLGYPMYFLTIQGSWKVLGGIVLLLPRFPLVKEWAYAGIIFNMTGAAFSNAACSMGAIHIISPLLIACINVVSWAFRPPSRRLQL